MWQLDLMKLRVLWLHFTIAALLDGCTRKLLQLKVYSSEANSKQMIALVRCSVKRFGIPRFLITDHGTQFRKRFESAIEAIGITQVKGRVRSPSFNGKPERLFKTLRLWQRFTLMPLTISGIQHRLDRFCDWHNTQRPHQALKYLTPEEARSGWELPDPTPIGAVDRLHTFADVRRANYRGDFRLPVPQISIALRRAA